MVIVEKRRNKTLRICLDPRHLNQAIKREHYHMPTLEEVIVKLAGAKYFSILDAKSGYWQIKLDPESAKLTTFNTPFGRYHFTRLPFGIHSSQDVFQKKVDEVYEGIQGVSAIVDDILVFGKTAEEHDQNLRALLERSRQKGLKLNPEKCKIKVQEVSYFGHKLTADGLKPDPAKIDAVKNMPTPKSKQELETILGMINYLAKFAPNLSDLTAPLHDLTKEKSVFLWDSIHDKAFEKVKEVITASPGPVLQYFDPTKEVTLQCDSSSRGVGATLMQEGKPVAYASRSLTVTQQNYAQIEKEMYAILFGCEKFHQYIYGQDVKVESDHKPLEAIWKNPLVVAAPRLQRMMLRLQKYTLTIKHKSGKDIPVADTLSRHFIDKPAENPDEFLEVQVHGVMSSLPVSNQKCSEISTETEKDPQLKQLKSVILSGWPNLRKDCPRDVLDFWNYRDELTIMNEMIFKGEKIVIPSSMRQEMLSILHKGHMEIDKTRQRGCDILFWPKMNNDIEQVITK